MTTTDIEQLSTHVNLGKEDTAVNLVWLPGNSSSTLKVVFHCQVFSSSKMVMSGTVRDLNFQVASDGR